MNQPLVSFWLFKHSLIIDGIIRIKIFHKTKRKKEKEKNIQKIHKKRHQIKCKSSKKIQKDVHINIYKFSISTKQTEINDK